jgi:hypothetical protein
MKLLIDSTDHFSFLQEAIAKKPSSVLIASYGLYAGVLPDGRDTNDWGPRFKSQTRDILESLRGVKDVRILIGLYEYKSCKVKVPCSNCERKYALDLIRHLNHAEKFKEFQWRVAIASHIKCILFDYKDTKLGVAGSRNFTDSSWEDISVTLDVDGVNQLEAHVNGVWKEAQPLNDEVIGTILEGQGISASTMESMTSGM